MTDLPPQDAKLYGALVCGAEVAISDLIAALGVRSRDPRTDQQLVGSYLTKLNRRIKARKQRIVPGRVKRTYVLIKIEA